MEYPKIPGYRLERLLGRGGMAAVYLALDEKFGRKVAVKVMGEELEPNAKYDKRFMREARLVAQLDHPYIIPVYDVGQYGCYHYIVMQYLPGGDLKERLRAQSGVSVGESIRIVKSIAAALDYAASQGCMHRDVKPENILLRSDEAPVLSDFGIARHTAPEEEATALTKAGMILGTPTYMSPEQATGGFVDARTDLYSLGVIFYEMLAGRAPYRGAPMDVVLQHVTAPVPELPEPVAPFQDFVEVALAKNLEERFQTGLEFVAELEVLEQEFAQLLDYTVVRHEESEDVSYHGMTGRRSSQRILGSKGVSRWLPGGTAGASRVARSRSGTRRKLTSRRSRLYRRWRIFKLSFGKRSAAQRAAFFALVMCLTGVGGVLIWRALAPDSAEYTPPVLHSVEIDSKRQPYLYQGVKSIEEGRYFNPEKHNAEYYLISLLSMEPESREGQAAVSQLFNIYLDQVADALSAGELDEAAELLNRSALLSFYVTQTVLLRRHKALRLQHIEMNQEIALREANAQRISRLLASGQRHFEAGRLVHPPDENAYDALQRVLQIDANNEEAKQGISEIAGTILAKASRAAGSGDVEGASRYLRLAAQIYPEHPDFEPVLQDVKRAKQVAVEAHLAKQREEVRLVREEMGRQRAEEARRRAQLKADKVAMLLAGFDENVAAGKLIAPDGDNALQKIRQVQELDPGNLGILDKLKELVQQLAASAEAALARNDLDQAELYLTEALQLSPGDPEIIEAQAALLAAQSARARDRARRQELKALVTQAKRDVRSDRHDDALGSLRKALDLDPQHSEASRLFDEQVAVLYRRAEAQIEARDLVVARETIDRLIQVNADKGQVNRLQLALNNASQLELAARARRQMIDGLLKKASAALQAGNNEESIRLLRKVISLDSTHAGAQQRLKREMSALFTLTGEQIRDQDYAAAERTLNLLVRVEADRGKLQRLRSSLDEAMRARELEAARQEKVRRYLAEAESASRAGRQVESIAYFERVLQLAPGDPQAVAAIAQQRNLLVGRGNAEVEAGDFDAAQTTLGQLAQVEADRETIDQLRRSLVDAQTAKKTQDEQEARLAQAEKAKAERAQQARQAEEARQREEARRLATAKRAEGATPRAKRTKEAVAGSASPASIAAAAALGSAASVPESTPGLSSEHRKDPTTRRLIAEAQSLEAQRRNEEINTRLRNIYQRLLRKDGEDHWASQQLNATSEYELELGLSAVKQRDFVGARRHAQRIARATPSHAGYQRLMDVVGATEAAVRQASAQLSEADQYIAIPYKIPFTMRGNTSVRNRLLSAYRLIGSARELDPGHPRLSATWRSLEDRYVSIISELLDRDKLNFAEVFLQDSAKLAWQTARIGELERRYQEQLAAGADIRKLTKGGSY